MMAATDPVLHAVLFGTDTQTEEDEATRLSFVENKARWNEAEEDHYSFQLDVPGVWRIMSRLKKRTEKWK